MVTSWEVDSKESLFETSKTDVVALAFEKVDSIWNQYRGSGL
jgi:hypothetical protein